MPLIVSEFDWSETPDDLFVTVPLKGATIQKTDVYANDRFVKVHFPPFLFELDLPHAVDFERSVTTIGDGFVKIHMKKLEVGVWGSLVVELSKEERMKQRQEADQRYQGYLENKAKEKRRLKNEEERKLVEKQIETERKERQKVEAILEKEKDDAQGQIASWECESGSSDPKDIFSSENLSQKPLPRQTTSIEVSFTPRNFFTPARENRDVEISRLLKKSKKPTSTDDQSNAERVFLRDKAHSLYQQGNFETAVNVYTSCLQIDANDLICYSNRAACYLKLKLFDEAISDCRKCIDLVDELLEDVTDGDPRHHRLLLSKKRAMVRQAFAYVGKEDVSLARTTYDTLVRLFPEDDQIRQDRDTLMSV